MKVLVACEFSGIVRKAFRRAGHDAWSCDLLPAEDGGEHIQGDAVKRLNDGWDLLIAHPPCTRLCNSGVRWLSERNLWAELAEAAEFFSAFLNAPISHIAVENPIMHCHAKALIREYYPASQIIQPWQFGHGETKAICLWLKGLPLLTPTDISAGREARVHRCSPGPDRWKERSRFFPGIAQAMAAQWGRIIDHRRDGDQNGEVS